MINNSSHLSLLQSFISCTNEKLLEEITICGGLAPALYNLPSIIELRTTTDIDVIFTIDDSPENPSPYIQHQHFVDQFLEIGFTAADPPICRYKHRENPEVLVDICTTLDTPIGPANTWYAKGVENRILSDALPLFVIPPIYFVATKFEAWKGRGKGDLWESKDLEDIITIFVGLPFLFEEIQDGKEQVHQFLRDELHSLLNFAGDQAAMVIEGHLGSVLGAKANHLLKKMQIVSN